jgi:hypothetical protein
VARPEQEREHAYAPPAHFSEAQAEQTLWQEFRDHGASLNNTLNEALRNHAGPAWRVFQVRVFSIVFWSFYCRMDLPGPTTSVGTRTDYSVGPWDYPACVTWHLKAWSTRTTQE